MKHYIFSRLFLVVLTCVISIYTSISIEAASFNKAVGQSFVLPVPKAPISNAALRSWSYSCRSSNINVTNSGGEMSLGEAVITSYFTGSETIECWYQYTIYNPNGTYTVGSSTEYHTVTCIGNNISISGPKKQLNVGESMQLSYSFASSTYGVTPQITWKSGSNVASVDYRGYVTALRSGEATITAQSNLGGNVASYKITVREIEPTSVSISPTTASVYCDGTVSLSATVYPSGAPQNVTWSLYEGSSSIASVSSSGVVSGFNPGSITVKATAKNGVYGTRVVNVYEPTLTQISTNPSNNATGQNAFISPTVIFSHTLNKGNSFEEISLKDSNGTNISGTASISGKSVIFSPTKPLAPNTKYTLTIPANSVKNKWGTSYSKVVTLNFTTGDLEKLTLSITPTNRFIKKGTSVKITSSKSNAIIYYTTDGSQPSSKSARYSKPILIESDVIIRAYSQLEGYSDSEVLSQEYIISNVAVTNCYPNDDNPLYNYHNVIPSITFSNKIEASSNIEKISFKCIGKGDVRKDIIVCDSAIYIIPSEQLQLGNVYQISVPVNAIKTWQGEYNEAAEWSFATGDFVKDISSGGPELSMALKSDNSLLTWGAKYISGSNTNGTYDYNMINLPTQFMDDVVAISSGYMHHAAIKSDGSLWLWGRQYCGEFGNGNTTASATPIKVLGGNVNFVCAGAQTTAIIKDDESLWMCGRNDFGQIGNGSTDMVKSFVKIMTDVRDVSVGWCNTFAVTKDNKLYAWGRNDTGQLLGITDNIVSEPTVIMEDVKMTSISVSSSRYFTAIKINGDLILWEAGSNEPQVLDNEVKYVTVGKDYIEYIKEDGSLWSYGINSYGQLGTGNLNDAIIPIKIMDGVKLVKTSVASTLAIKENGSVWSWGHNVNNLLGQQNLTSEICLNPSLIIEGMPISELSGLNCYKKGLTIPLNSYGIIPVFPIPLTANYNSIEWTSSNPEFVTVDDKGIVYGVAMGESNVTATIQDHQGKVYDIVCGVNVGNESGIENIYGDNLQIWTDGLDVHIKNVPERVTVSLIGMNGIKITTSKSMGQEIVLKTPYSGVCIINIGQHSYKVVCK